MYKARKKLILHLNTLNHTSFCILTSIGIGKGFQQFLANVTIACTHTPALESLMFLKPDKVIKEFYQREFSMELKDDKVQKDAVRVSRS